MSAVTEEEARKRWCPFARSTSEPGNRAPYGTPRDLPADPEYELAMAAEFPCIASRCMAWRSLGQRWLVTRRGKETELSSWNPTGSTLTGYRGCKVKPTILGYCGLSGPVTP